MCGEKTIEMVSITKNSSSLLGSSTKNTSSRTWPLITKDQVTRLPKKSEIILAEASFPIKCQKVAYNIGSDAKIFEGRLLSPPSIPSLEIERYGIPKFDIADGSTKEEADPNQGNLFKNGEKPEPEESSGEAGSSIPKEDEKNKKDNPHTGLFFDKDDEDE